MIDHEVGVITHLYSEPSSMLGCFAHLKDSLSAVLPSLRLVLPAYKSKPWPNSF